MPGFPAYFTNRSRLADPALEWRDQVQAFSLWKEFHAGATLVGCRRSLPCGIVVIAHTAVRFSTMHSRGLSRSFDEPNGGYEKTKRCLRSGSSSWRMGRPPVRAAVLLPRDRSKVYGRIRQPDAKTDNRSWLRSA